MGTLYNPQAAIDFDLVPFIRIPGLVYELDSYRETNLWIAHAIHSLESSRINARTIGQNNGVSNH